MFAKKRESCPKNNPDKSDRKRISMSLQVEQCLQDAHLMKKKINSIVTEEKIELKNCVKN